MSSIVRLTLDDVIRDGDTVLLRLGESPSPIPEPVADLLLEHIAHRENMNTATNPASRWLFPGRRAGQSFRPDHLSALLNEIGIPAAAARGAAIRQQLLDMRPRGRGRARLPQQDHHPAPQRDRRHMEPIRPRRSRKVTSGLDSSGHRRQLITRVHQYQGRSAATKAQC
ncbi:hypothetical protein [Streptomyces sp. enrichment culture]|uniref:hypothetical protein n=1 Tax=Streptomyces sp. enrichment culture TaxID=1795815 RepID=UPI003F558888